MNNFLVIIRYQNRNLQYESKNDELELDNDENINMKLLKERALKIIVDDKWNNRLYINADKKKKTSH